MLRTFNSCSTTTHHTPLITHQSSYTTHHTPLIIHHSSHTTDHTPLIIHHSSYTTHHTPRIHQLWFQQLKLQATPAPGADCVAGAALCEPPCADFVAGAALCEPPCADFVADSTLCTSMCRCRAGAVQNALWRDSERTKCCIFQWNRWLRSWQVKVCGTTGARRSRIILGHGRNRPAIGIRGFTCVLKCRFRSRHSAL